MSLRLSRLCSPGSVPLRIFTHFWIHERAGQCEMSCSDQTSPGVLETLASTCKLDTKAGGGSTTNIEPMISTYSACELEQVNGRMFTSILLESPGVTSLHSSQIHHSTPYITSNTHHIRYYSYCITIVSLVCFANRP